MPEEIPL